MEIAKSGRKKMKRNVRYQDLVGLKRNQQKSLEENEKIVEEMQQQMLQLEKELKEKTILHKEYISRLEYQRLIGHVDQRLKGYPLDRSDKMALDKLTFANKAYLDKKTVTSFSSGKREINIHNLNHQMLHKSNCMNSERRLLKMLNPNKDTDSGPSVEEQLQKQIYKLHCLLGWPHYSKNTIDRETYERKIKELDCEKDEVFVNAPPKGTLWNSLPSTKELRINIQDMEATIYERKKFVFERREKVESMERKMKKVENEVKSTRRMMEIIRRRIQRALKIISHQKSCLENITTL